MRSTWTRLSGQHRTRDVQKGLQARIADGLWMLTRQWQFGGFKGEDAASPVKAGIKYDSLDISSLVPYRAGGKAGTPVTLGADELLEPVVERENVLTGAISLRLSAEAGVQFLRRLPREAQGAARNFLKLKCPLAAPEDRNAGNAKFLALLIAGSFDADTFAKRFTTLRGAVATATGMAEAALQEIFDSWYSCYAARFSVPTTKAGENWQKDRMEYRFDIEAKHATNGMTARLSAEGYTGGRLDWWHFAFHESKTSGLARDFSAPRSTWLIPSPVRYAGMPADRYWNFEDGQVFFGGLTAGATDLAQLVLTEFATVYSNDWYMLPLTVKTGTLTRISAVDVVDSFGETTRVSSTALIDGAKRAWRFFELQDDPSVENERNPWLYVPRTVLGGNEDRPVEKVVMTRDDMANLAWGIEETLEGQSGHRVARNEQWLARRAETQTYLDETETVAEGDAWTYRLLSVVPPYWIPFVPEVAADGRVTNRLLRGRMGEWDLLGDLKAELAGAQGKILAPEAPLAIQEEEIPRGAIEITRSYQSARDAQGNVVIWAGRRKRPSSGNRSSGRQTDKVEV